MESSFSSPVSSSTNSQPTAAGRGLTFRHRGMQTGLMARAALYAENVSKANSNVNRFNRINLPKKDSMIWGDASNRYVKNIEINNNNFQNDEQNLPQDTETKSGDNPEISVAQWENDVIMTSSPLVSDPTQNLFGPPGTGYKNFPSKGEIDSDVIEEESEDAGKDLETSDNQLSFNTTQQLRSGFFRSIKRQYSPILPVKGEKDPNRFHSFNSSDTDSTTGSRDGQTDDSGESDVDKDKSEDLSNSGNMTQLARQKLQQLRRQGAHNLDVSTGLQWIRLELVSGFPFSLQCCYIILHQ